MYTVQVAFIDPDDFCRVYHPGDAYPGPGYTPGPDRVAQLVTDGWIRPVKAEPAPEPKPAAHKKKTK